MANADRRSHRRTSVSLHGELTNGDSKGKAQIISISSGGCAFRTTVHLEKGKRCTLHIPVEIGEGLEMLEVPAEIVWGTADYRIDTFYRYGVHFPEPLSEHGLNAILCEETLSAEIPGHQPVPPANKEVA